LAQPKPVLVVVGGIIASGKTTIAEAIAARLGASRISADDVRRDYAEADTPEAELPGFSDTVYLELLRRAEGRLQEGGSVVLDGTFRSRRHRAAARELAARCAVPFRLVECRASPALCRARLADRGGPDEVAGWLALFDHFIEHLWEPVDEIPELEHRSVDTSVPLETALESLSDWLEIGSSA
jgi:predicted kinase